MNFSKAIRFQRLSFPYSNSRKPQEIGIRSSIITVTGENHREKKSSDIQYHKASNWQYNVGKLKCSYHIIM